MPVEINPSFILPSVHQAHYAEMLSGFGLTMEEFEALKDEGFCRIVDRFAEDAAQDLERGRFDTFPVNTILTTLFIGPERLRRDTPLIFRIIDYTYMISQWENRYEEMPVQGLVRCIGAGVTAYEPWGLLRPTFLPEAAGDIALILREIASQGIQSYLSNLDEDDDPFRPRLGDAGVQLVPLPFRFAHFSEPLLGPAREIRPELIDEIAQDCPQYMDPKAVTSSTLANFVDNDPSLRGIFTSDSVQSLALLEEKADLLISARMDPEIFGEAERHIFNPWEFQRLFIQFNENVINQVKDGGHIFITVGAGNGTEGTINRIMLIHTLNKLCLEQGRQYRRIYHPFSSVMKRAFWTSNPPWVRHPKTIQEYLFLGSVGELVSQGGIQFEVTPEIRETIIETLQSGERLEGLYTEALEQAQRVDQELNSESNRYLDRIDPPEARMTGTDRLNFEKALTQVRERRGGRRRRK